MPMFQWLDFEEARPIFIGPIQRAQNMGRALGLSIQPEYSDPLLPQISNVKSPITNIYM